MNYKKTILTVGFILIGTIAYLSYLLYKKDHPSVATASKPNIIEKSIHKKDEPKITIKIDPNEHKKATRASTKHSTKQIPNSNTQNPLSSSLSDEERIKESAEKIQKDMQELFKSILSSKEVQENIKEMQKQLKEGVKQLQQELQNLPDQLDNVSNEMKKDPFFGEVLQQLSLVLKNELKDSGDKYQLAIPVPYGKDSNIDIKTKGDMLLIDIKSLAQNANSKRSSFISKTITIPKNAKIGELSTKYKDDMLLITIPKDIINKVTK